MYRSSFGTIEGRRSVCSERSLLEKNDLEPKVDEKVMCFPPTVAGESVVWCKPGVVAKLMGLEAIPVPVRRKRCDSKDKMSSVGLRRRSFERHDLERKLAMDMQGYRDHIVRRRNRSGFCSNNDGYCIMKPVSLEAMAGGPSSWQPRRYV
ncbi:hypothetical protein A2U01_0033922 [Trifolium medium]|uniref:DUF3741 domain-containing protein n=1 Tax=Trifolium medium TaxID=97028 RepID=A0A392PPH8_9FABA|nr:hypothetical protein [Trifolium medium]